ncbi:hypothetical protein [Alteromonas sp. C1M14]|uniref:hypothetical protein n=1 Tax=Alteromonas sp. C1M14 TaxID=2841567 RepID=UPI001C0A0BF6|nr:hypothetical protein [Alteromonas sp. C1M14]MBU2980100.1 hypothetical protein [Alteromonas sp. C1M14]
MMSHHAMADVPGTDMTHMKEDCCQSQCDCDATLCHQTLVVLSKLPPTHAVSMYDTTPFPPFYVLSAHRRLLFKPPRS